MRKILPMGINKGVPGGWGSPRQPEAAKNSPQSQKAIEGPAVIKKTIEAMIKTNNAIIELSDPKVHAKNRFKRCSFA